MFFDIREFYSGGNNRARTCDPACKADALPAELCFHLAGVLPVWQLKIL